MLNGQPKFAQLAVTDWNYSWLLRTDGPTENEFNLLPRRVTEIAERGFNVLRVDAWPHLLSAAEEDQTAGQFTIAPVHRHVRLHSSWQPREVKPADRLLRLAQAAKENGVYLWLTSWLWPDSMNHGSTEQTPDSLIKIWHTTLNHLHTGGVLSAVIAVDFMHLFLALPQQKKLARFADQNRATTLNRFLQRVPQNLRSIYPQLYFGMSVEASMLEQTAGLDLGELDFLDLRIADTYAPWHRSLSTGNLPASFFELCQQHQLIPALSGGPRSLPRRVSLTDICRLSEQAVAAAGDKGIDIINPCQRAWPGQPLWDEEAWLNQVNHHLRAD